MVTGHQRTKSSELCKAKTTVAVLKQEDRLYGKFVCEPLERGHGITMGNALRRVLLSSLQGAACVSVKFSGVQHEFTTIEGVLEDVTDIIPERETNSLSMDTEEP